MDIGIIGAGNIGGTLAQRLTALGHNVSIANSRGPDTLTEVAQRTGAKPVSVDEAVQDKDLIVVTIPEKSVAELPKGLFAQVPSSVPVVDTGNYYPRQRDGRIEPIEAGMTESRWASEQIGHPVIKAFNNMVAQKLMNEGKPKGAPGRLALPVAGDDAAAKAKVMALVDDLGFDPIDNGGLDDSWRQQPGQPAYITDSDAAQLNQRLAAAEPRRKPDFSGTASSPGSWSSPQ